MNKKNKINTNMLPQDMMMKQTYKKCILPILILLVISITYLSIATVGSKILGDKYINQAEEVKAKSVYGENLKLEQEIETLQNDMKDKEQIIDSMKRQNESATEERIDNNYKIENLINYIYKIKPKNITIILVEDDGTSVKGDSNIIEETESLVAEGKEEVKDAEGKEEVKDLEESTDIEEKIDPSKKPDEFSLKYKDDIRNSGIQIRGFSTNKESLAVFLKKLGEYEEMSRYKVNAVETVQILDDDLDVFDITIAPR